MEYGLIGETLSHSFSKTVHGKLFDYSYELKEIAPSELDRFMREADFRAVNVTIPYKQAVIPYLDEIEENARKIGAVNTVVKRDGKLFGFNTDYLGLLALLQKHGIVLAGKKVLILGGGGTAGTAFAVAETLGAKEIVKVSRTEKDGFVTYEQAVRLHADARVILNMTPCGMYPRLGESAIDIDRFENLTAVADAVYNPIDTALVTKAKARHLPAAGGLYMLVAQAVFAAEKFTGQSVPKERIDEIYGELLSSKRNAVLIGMPGCGKTTVGKALAKELGKRFLDTDEEIVTKTGMTIPAIFEQYGEERFRQIESEVIKEIAASQSAVIATGGGAVLKEENMALLKENGTVLFLDRPLDLLVTTDDRPLSSTRQALEKRYKERIALYRRAADVTIDASGSIKENIRKAKEGFLHENSGDERTELKYAGHS